MSKGKKTNKNQKGNFTVPHSKFIEYLESLKQNENRGALAALRRGLQHDLGKCVDMYPYVIPWIKNVKGKWNTQMHYLIASLYAYHPSSGKTGNFGEVFHKIFQKQGENKSIEQRFITLLRSNPEDLALHMRQAISLAKSQGIPIDWHRLFYDLKRWQNESRFPPYESWAQSFWKNVDINKNQEENQE